MDLDELCTREQAAAEFKITPNSILDATQRGEIAYYPVGRRHLYRLRDVRAWLEARKVAPKVKLGGIPAKASKLAAARRSRAS